MVVARVDSLGAFVDVVAGDPVAGVTNVADAEERAISVSADGLRVAGIRATRALVYIIA